MAKSKVIKEIDWNGNHYTFTNSFYQTGTKSHDILTMEDDKGNSWQGETTWINRPWHSFDLEEAFTKIVEKAFGSKAKELILKINQDAYSVESAIEKFFDEFNAEDIEKYEGKESTEIDRKQALINYLELNEEEAEEVEEGYNENEFEVNGDTYLVLTDEEADELFDERVRDLWDELGLEAVRKGSYIYNNILENCIDEDWAEDWVREDIESYVYDLSDEEVAEECVDDYIVEEDDVYDEDGYIKDDVDIDDLRDKLIEKKFEDVDDYAEYITDLGFDNDYYKDHIDEDKAVEVLKDDIDVNGYGRGQELAPYDFVEIELENGLYAYRQ